MYALAFTGVVISLVLVLWGWALFEEHKHYPAFNSRMTGTFGKG